MFIFGSIDLWQPCRPVTADVYMEADAVSGPGRLTSYATVNLRMLVGLTLICSRPVGVKWLVTSLDYGTSAALLVHCADGVCEHVLEANLGPHQLPDVVGAELDHGGSGGKTALTQHQIPTKYAWTHNFTGTKFTKNYIWSSYRLCKGLKWIDPPLQRQTEAQHGDPLRQAHGSQHLRPEDARVAQLHPLAQALVVAAGWLRLLVAHHT